MKENYLIGITDDGTMIAEYTNFKSLIEILEGKNWISVYVTSSYEEWTDQLPKWRVRI